MPFNKIFESFWKAHPIFYFINLEPSFETFHNDNHLELYERNNTMYTVLFGSLYPF